MNLESKTIVLGVTGSIAAYKIAELASALVKLKADVHVIMTKNALNFITPVTFETLTHNKCLVDTFDRNFEFNVEHVSLAQKADVFLVAPATANIIAKIAHGIADDMLTTTILASKCPKLVSPTMNTAMLNNPITKDNIQTLNGYGFTIIKPANGFLACGDIGDGKMPEPTVLLEHICMALSPKDMLGLNVLVTAGPTIETLDPVRYLTNHSTGKMGYAIAQRAAYRGANVTLVSGPTTLNCPLNVNRIDVTSARDMAHAVMDNFNSSNIIIKAAAVADYRPAQIADDKIKKTDDNLSIPLERTTDILSYIGSHKTDKQFICGFSMETNNLIENTKEKLKKKNVDLMVANNLKQQGAGFSGDTNIVTLISATDTQSLPLLSKEEVADKLLNYIISHRK